MSKSKCILFAGAFALTVFPPPAVGSVDILSPGNGECVTLLPEPQRRIMALPTYEERLRAFREDKERGGSGYFDSQDAKWRTSLPLVLKWMATDAEKGPWRIALGRSPDMEDAVVWWVEDKEMEPKESDSGTLYCWTVPRPNLEPGASYYWKIWSDVKCRAAHCHGSTMSGSCPECGRKGRVHESDVFRFTTDTQAPRWIDLEGRVENVRDIGGWRTVDGRRVKFGMAFRGQGLNDNSANGEAVGKSRLMVEDVSYMKDVLHVKTDLDLRNRRETAGMTSSPLGSGVNYIQRASPLYNWIFENPKGIDQFGSEGKRTMAANFRVFCDEGNYPIYFHCIGGADRTGSLAYVLNGVLGVPRHDLEVDWESTFYPTLPEMSPGYSGTNFWRRIQYFAEGFSRYGDENTTWNERIRLYLLDCGITDEEIDRFRSIMLEEVK